MKVSFKQLQEFFKDKDFGSEEFRLDKCTLIKDQNMFVKSHLNVLKANSGNKVAMPYWKRLVQFYKLKTK